ncbi:cytidine deaminase [candidate division WWE3 bacterium]|uniref:Cytidine deaminase n=1 Tax=candidate division WWE3 bacterium TaxID=2053526 RepID=A0A7X9HSQ6_UNCKA|nr:cytidine deaminase [candidate division WWE3 bacterium]
MLSESDKNLVEEAKKFFGKREVKGGTIGHAGCALISESDQIFTGSSLHLYCGIGFCGEHTAISQMLSQTKDTFVKTIVSWGKDGILPPCGRCRELLNLIDERNLNTEVIISNDKKVKLSDLLPYAWK